jgi:hypothetical protein
LTSTPDMSCAALSDAPGHLQTHALQQNALGLASKIEASIDAVSSCANSAARSIWLMIG